MDEVFVLANALRFYDVEILAKLAAGKGLDAAERARIAAHLENDRDIAGKIEAVVRVKLGTMPRG